jgi:hypothetical protein
MGGCFYSDARHQDKLDATKLNGGGWAFFFSRAAQVQLLLCFPTFRSEMKNNLSSTAACKRF